MARILQSEKEKVLLNPLEDRRTAVGNLPHAPPRRQGIFWKIALAAGIFVICYSRKLWRIVITENSGKNVMMGKEGKYSQLHETSESLGVCKRLEETQEKTTMISVVKSHEVLKCSEASWSLLKVWSLCFWSLLKSFEHLNSWECGLWLIETPDTHTLTLTYRVEKILGF